MSARTISRGPQITSSPSSNRGSLISCGSGQMGNLRRVGSCKSIEETLQGVKLNKFVSWSCRSSCTTSSRFRPPRRLPIRTSRCVESVGGADVRDETNPCWAARTRDPECSCGRLTCPRRVSTSVIVASKPRRGRRDRTDVHAKDFHMLPSPGREHSQDDFEGHAQRRKRIDLDTPGPGGSLDVNESFRDQITQPFGEHLVTEAGEVFPEVRVAAGVLDERAQDGALPFPLKYRQSELREAGKAFGKSLGHMAAQVSAYRQCFSCLEQTLK